MIIYCILDQTVAPTILKYVLNTEANQANGRYMGSAEQYKWFMSLSRHIHCILAVAVQEIRNKTVDLVCRLQECESAAEFVHFLHMSH